MLYLEVQKGEESMNISEFQKQIGGTVACMNIIVRDKKGFGQLKSDFTYFSDIWFSGVRISEAVMD